MRTTVDLPEDIHRKASAIARDTSRTLSETVADLLRQAIERPANAEITRSKVTGLPVLSIGRVVTSEDVRRLEEEEDEARWSSSSTRTS
ncbi:MAG: antitoxin [Dehalococcoidia bacterium]